MFEPRHYEYVDEFVDVQSQAELDKRLEDLDFRLENPVPTRHIILRVTINTIVIIGLGLLLRFLYGPKPIAKRPVKYPWSTKKNP